jgi:diguanylate cyclase (GGDEF)-like protein
MTAAAVVNEEGNSGNRRANRNKMTINWKSTTRAARNDQLGHQTGDELLIKVAQVLSTRLRNIDMAARIGGDEFIILLPETASEAAKQLIDSLFSELLHAM